MAFSGYGAASADSDTGADAPEWPVNIVPYGGKLLLSDSPENVHDNGITYQDKVDGDARLFFHHVNATTIPKKVVVLVANDGDRTAHVKVTQYGLGGPGTDFLAVGKQAQERYMQDADDYTVDVPAKNSALLSGTLRYVTVMPGQLLNGIYDFHADEPVLVKVMVMPVMADPAKFAATAKILPKDSERLRGTFDKPDRMVVPTKVYDPRTDDKVAITLADNRFDGYLQGRDATDGSSVTNYGNYGVMYKIYISSAYDGRLACYLNPQGGEFAGVMSVKYRYHYLPLVDVPAGRVYMGSGTTNDYALVGTFDGGQSLWLNFSPPGASNLPVRLVISPWVFGG